MRNTNAGIVAGSNTIINDNPSLLTKIEYLGKIEGASINHPVRIVFDRRGRCPQNAKVFQNQHLSPTIWITTSNERIEGITKIYDDSLKNIVLKINQKLNDLGKQGKVMIEGGGQLITSFINHNLISYIRIFRSSMIFPQGRPLFSNEIENSLSLKSIKKLGDGIEEIYLIKKETE